MCADRIIGKDRRRRQTNQGARTRHARQTSLRNLPPHRHHAPYNIRAHRLRSGLARQPVAPALGAPVSIA
ncbi:hypothetical protein CNMCM6457_000718 [Aspergillus fumigatiaffinis]|nr:hypothetical protein CNMCM6457_000718 [Aspergillus fumigatiaffinis]